MSRTFEKLLRNGYRRVLLHFLLPLLAELWKPGPHIARTSNGRTRPLSDLEGLGMLRKVAETLAKFRIFLILVVAKVVWVIVCARLP